MMKKKKHAPDAVSWKDGLMPTYEYEGEGTENTYVRMTIFIFVGFCLMLLMVGRLFHLQVINAGQYSVLAETNRITEKHIPYERGLIIDADGVLLARNIPSYEAIVRLDEVSLEDMTHDWRVHIGDIFGLEPIEIETTIDQAIQKQEHEVVLKQEIDQELFITYQSSADTLPGVYVQPTMKRYYPSGNATAHIVGYLGELNQEERSQKEFADYLNGEEVGRLGIEAQYQTLLRGTPGVYEYTAKQGEVNNSTSILRDAVPGQSVSLSISGDLQKRISGLLEASMDEYDAPSGVVIVQEVNTGQIKAMVMLPSFDNNVFADGLDEQEYKALFENEIQPLYNRGVAGEYPPGSLVKPFVGAAALQEGIITANSVLTDTPQVIEIGGGRFADWRVSWGRGPYGPMTVQEAIAQSSNIFYYKISGGYEGQEGLGIRRIAKYLNTFGIGENTGIDLPSETAGVVPNPAWKLANKNENWYLGDDYQTGIGQGNLLVTPLQMVNAVSSIANGGVLYQPRLVSAIYDQNESLIEELQPVVIREVAVADSHIKTIQDGMRLAVSDGIIFPLRNAKVPVAAKTGTAEFGERDDEGIYKTHAWVEGYAPYENPEYSFVVLLENGGSSSYAAELAEKVIEILFDE